MDVHCRYRVFPHERGYHLNISERNNILILFFDNYPMEDICKGIGCSQSTVYKWVNVFERTGTILTDFDLHIHDSRVRIFGNEELDYLDNLIGEHPEFALDEYGEFLGDHFPGQIFHVSSVFYALHSLGYTRKKMDQIRGRASEVERNFFTDWRQDIHCSAFVAIDEVGFKVSHSGNIYGYSQRGERCIATEPMLPSHNTSSVVAVAIDGIVGSPVLLDGGVKGDDFLQCLEQEVFPSMNQIVVSSFTIQ
eukprot:TRINITY_DN717_c0_g2_i2.p1 TRINITY_DN717_c0_g2~~TRINITY_DN717_c0_g2_i2.p1  ORF type:complete len:250 (+),score=38.61 TRINITY_DN717_c0_g2_i2:41-790(+)